MIPQLCGLRHQKETRQKTAESQFLNAKIEPIQDILAHRRIALATKVLRQDNDSPMRMVSFKKDTAAPVEVLFRRVGRPRKQWTQNTLTVIWRKIRDDQSDFNNSNAQLAQILQAAINKEI